MSSCTRYVPRCRFRKNVGGSGRERASTIQGSEKAGRSSTAALLRVKAAWLPSKTPSAAISMAIKREQENGVGRLWVPRRLKDQPANRRHDHAEENHGRGVGANGVIPAPDSASANRSEIPSAEQCKRPAGQNQEPGEDQDVQRAREAVPRMPPLRQPELQHPRRGATSGRSKRGSLCAASSGFRRRATI